MSNRLRYYTSWSEEEEGKLEPPAKEKLKSVEINRNVAEMSSISTPYDMSKLLQEMKCAQEQFRCNNCLQEYGKKWCRDDDATCFYCTNFLPMRDTYKSILKDIDWYYMKSGETSRPEFYKAYLDNLQKWSARFHVFPTKQDKQDEEELRATEDWTREYWH
jgi:hypothetical protein